MRLKTFGGLSIQCDQGPLAGAASQRRRLALLALLAAAGERGLSRDKILGHLWADGSAERARGALAQALYALRRDLGQEELFLGTTEVRLNPAALPSDLAEFCAAFRAGRYADAVALYEGPFLDGFYLNDAAEFERWVETERARLAHDHAVALEHLAEAAGAAGDALAAVGWWKRLAAADPLNARVTVGLMRALAAAGDRGGAIQHARVYEALLRQELDLAPDPMVTRLAEEYRKQQEEPRPPAATPAIPTPERIAATDVAATAVATADAATDATAVKEEPAWVPAPSGELVAPTESPALTLPAWLRPGVFLPTIAVLALASVLLVLLAPPTSVSMPGTGTVPLVAVGQFVDNSADQAPHVERPLSDMLATNLARAPGMQVISMARMYELAGQVGGPDADGALVRAARAAGADELIDGAYYELGPDSLRLDVRRTDLATGRVRQAITVEGRDLFTLVERGTRELVASLGGTAPSRSLADVTTTSVVAYRLYAEGLRAFYTGRDRTGARRLFQAALDEDSTFAMAAYYAAVTAPSRAAYADAMQRALRLSAHAGERDRLRIRTEWAYEMDDPARLALAESLATRYPAEPLGHLLLAQSLMWDGRQEAAVREYRRVIAMDSLSLRDPSAPRCLACEAYAALGVAYAATDSFPAVERTMREWVRRQPGSPAAWGALANVLLQQDRIEEAAGALRTAIPLDPGLADWPLMRTLLALHAGDFARADAEIQRWSAGADTVERQSARWWRIVSLRMQGRLAEALAAARDYRAHGEPPAGGGPGAASYDALQEAQVLYEAGELRASAALFDSVARLRQPFDQPSRLARHAVWVRTLGAAPRAAMGDTAGFAALADSLAILGQRSALGRDNHLYHQVRGLLFAARRQPAQAAAEFARVIFYSRGAYEQARALLAAGRGAEAVAPLQSALRTGIDGPNLYVTRTELHALLGDAWHAAGNADSAAAHWRWATQAWRGADPGVAVRREEIAGRLGKR